MIRRGKASDKLLLAALFCSGIAALGFELMWTRLLSLVVGGEVLGILGVLAGFFGGMVLGAVWLSKRAALSLAPLKSFYILESCIAIYGLISPFIILKLSTLIPVWLGPVAGDNNSTPALLITVVLSGVLLLPATFCMGANFAYLVEARRRIFSRQGKSKNVGRIYAANTAGALAGTMLSVYLVVPVLGFGWSAAIFSLISILSIILAWKWGKSLGKKESRLSNSRSVSLEPGLQKEEKFWMILLFFTGLLAIGFEIVVIHLLKQVLENTIYTFANILSVYLIGTALGSWIFQALPLKKRNSPHFPPIILLLLVLYGALDILLGANLLSLVNLLSPKSTILFLHLTTEWIIACLFFLIPSLLMGGLFAYLVGKIKPLNVGRAYAVNTLGATLAPFLFGLIFIPVFGSYYSILCTLILYTLLLMSFSFLFRWKRNYTIAGLSVCVVVLLIPGKSFNLIELQKGWIMLEKKEGLMGSVVVSELPGQKGPLGLPLRILQVNNRFRMGGGAGFLESRMGHLPMLLSKDAQDVLFLGIGTGITLGAATNHRVNKVVGVEIVPEVTELLHWFEEQHQRILNNPRVEIHTADARRFVLSYPERFDLIVADLYHPARDGAGMLYTREHFEHLKSKLKPDGMVVQWIPLHQFDSTNLKLVLRTYQSVFPELHMFLGSYNPNTPVIALVAGPQNFKIDAASIDLSILSVGNVRQIYENLEDLVASYVTGPKGIKRFAGEGQINTDLHPRLLFNAPSSAYIPELELSRINLDHIAKLKSTFPSGLFENTPSSRIQILQSHWKAAGHFIDFYRSLRTGKNERAIQGLLEAYKQEPDFSPARGKILESVQSGALPYERVEFLLTAREKARLGKN